jgi:hypothetical protein
MPACDNGCFLHAYTGVHFTGMSFRVRDKNAIPKKTGNEKGVTSCVPVSHHGG